VAEAEPTAATEHKLRVVLVGDSTVAEKSGWGTAFMKLLAPDVECTNAARGGQSTKSFLDGGNWQKALALKPDWVLIQFGHNDQPGKGPNRETDPETTYRANLIRYVDEARAAGAKPVLVTSMVRRTFQPDKQHLRVDLEPYVAAMKKVAEEKKVPLVDLHARSHELIEKLGASGVAEAKMEAEAKPPATHDGTHLNEHGGEIIAPLVADELRKVAPELAAHLAPVK
ncbi:MAG: rhamnogalacturonan acetylesterase, partial [Chthoniobacter sp.]